MQLKSIAHSHSSGNGKTIEASSEAGSVFEDSYLASLHGYAGDSCPECGNFSLVRNGTCLKCITCGTTTGCS